jgi:hypothetical protein
MAEVMQATILSLAITAIQFWREVRGLNRSIIRKHLFPIA